MHVVQNSALVRRPSTKQLRLLSESAPKYGLNPEHSWWKRSVFYYDLDEGWTVEVHVNTGTPRRIVRGRTIEELCLALWTYRNGQRGPRYDRM